MANKQGCTKTNVFTHSCIKVSMTLIKKFTNKLSIKNFNIHPNTSRNMLSLERHDQNRHVITHRHVSVIHAITFQPKSQTMNPLNIQMTSFNFIKVIKEARIILFPHTSQ